MPLTVWSSARYTFPLPPGHRFPVEKYAMLRERVVSEGIVSSERVLDPDAASDEMLRLVHTSDYVTRFVGGALTTAEVRRLGFPWSEALVERSRRGDIDGPATRTTASFAGRSAIARTTRSASATTRAAPGALIFSTSSVAR